MADRRTRTWSRYGGTIRHRGNRRKKRYYVISEGWKTGIFTDLTRYNAAISGFPEPRTRQFSNYEDAKCWLRIERYTQSLRHQATRKLFAQPAPAPVQKEKKSKQKKKKDPMQQLLKGSKKIKKHLYQCNAHHVFALDIEYTGFTPDAEILQVSVINGLGMVICNQYFKPERITDWSETIPIHGITPEMVADKPYFRTYAPHLSQVFADAEAIVGYSTMQDIALLNKGGVIFPEKAIYLDAGESYSFVTAKENEPRTYAKLQDCAAHYGYTGDGWHNSLADTKATLFCFYALLDDEKTLFRLHYFRNRH